MQCKRVRFTVERTMKRLRTVLAVLALLLTTTGCFLTDIFDFDKDDGIGCPPDRSDSVCTPIDGGVTPMDMGREQPCPFIAGGYSVNGCQTQTCSFAQDRGDCFVSLTCETPAGTQTANSFLEEDGSLVVNNALGTCNLRVLPNGTITGGCSAGLVGSCTLTATPQ